MAMWMEQGKINYKYSAITNFVILLVTLPFSSSVNAATSLPNLTQGLYVADGATCTNPARSQVRYFDPKNGIGNQFAWCKIKEAFYDSGTYRLKELCTDMRDKDNSIWDIAIKVLDDKSFWFRDLGAIGNTDGTVYRYCGPR